MKSTYQQPYTIAGIEEKFKAAFDVTYLKITNTSASHANHHEMANVMPTHILIEISSPMLNPKKPILAHKAIYKMLEEELRQGLHAISIKVI